MPAKWIFDRGARQSDRSLVEAEDVATSCLPKINERLRIRYGIQSEVRQFQRALDNLRHRSKQVTTIEFIQENGRSESR